MFVKKFYSCSIVGLLVVKRFERDDNRLFFCFLFYKIVIDNNLYFCFLYKVMNFCMYGISVSGIIEELIRDFDSYI